jgi:hydroxymethylbilane synthase
VGYTHPRQRAQLLIHLRPLGLELVRLTGSAESRLQQMASRGLDGLIISAESLELVGSQDRACEIIGESVLLPAPGAGCLGFLTRREDPEIEELLEAVEDRTSRLETMAERAFLDRLGGDPELALGARAALDSHSMIVEGIFSNADGSVFIRDAIQGPATAAGELGAKLAELLLALGDEELHRLVAGAS